MDDNQTASPLTYEPIEIEPGLRKIILFEIAFPMLLLLLGTLRLALLLLVLGLLLLLGLLFVLLILLSLSRRGGSDKAEQNCRGDD